MPSAPGEPAPSPRPLNTDVASILYPTDKLETEVLSIGPGHFSQSRAEAEDPTRALHSGEDLGYEPLLEWTPKQWDSRSSGTGLSGNVMRGLW